MRILGTFAAVFWLVFNHNACARTVRYNWKVTAFEAAPDGFTRVVYGINGRLGHDNPIEVDFGDTIEVLLVNGINEPTCIHWHGMEQRGTPEMDGASGITQCSILPGQSTLYRFTPTRPGSFWWHSHDGTQYVDGLRGPLIVRDTNNRQPWAALIAREFIVEIDDWYHERSELLLQQFTDPAQNPNGDEPVWTTVLLNNRGRFDCSVLSNSSANCITERCLSKFGVVEGQYYLLRVINSAAFAAFDFSIDEHEFNVVAVDGDYVMPSRPLPVVRLNVGQRYDLLVKADGITGRKYWMRATSLFGAPWTSLPLEQFPVGFDPNGLAVVSYDIETEAGVCCDGVEVIESTDTSNEQPISELDFIPIHPQRLPETPDQRMLIQFTMQMTSDGPLGYISINNGSSNTFKMPTTPTLFEIAGGVPTSSLPASSNAAKLDFGRHVEIVLVNSDVGEHPFHMHGHSPWVVGSGNMPSAATSPPELNLHNPLTRDTYTVPGCTADADGNCQDVGYVALRLNADDAGVWMLHCHIEWHLATGLAMMFVEGEDILQWHGLEHISREMQSTCLNV